MSDKFIRFSEVKGNQGFIWNRIIFIKQEFNNYTTDGITLNAYARIDNSDIWANFNENTLVRVYNDKNEAI